MFLFSWVCVCVCAGGEEGGREGASFRGEGYKYILIQNATDLPWEICRL